MTRPGSAKAPRLLWLVFEVVSFAVHLLLIAAAVFVVWGLVKRCARKVGL